LHFLKYEKQPREKKALWVRVLLRNIHGLSKDEIEFMGKHPSGLAYVITLPENAALQLFCLLKDPLPEWSFSLFGPVEVKFNGLPGNIKMRFQTPGEQN
jgi:hypothetical protein